MQFINEWTERGEKKIQKCHKKHSRRKGLAFLAKAMRGVFVPSAIETVLIFIIA